MPAHVWKEITEPVRTYRSTVFSIGVIFLMSYDDPVQIPSPYYTPLDILQIGAMNLLKPPQTAIKTTMLSALKKGWDGMMERVSQRLLIVSRLRIWLVLPTSADRWRSRSGTNPRLH